MTSIDLLNRIDTYVQNLIQNEVQELWEYSDRIAKKFKLQILDISGTTRIVFKKKGSRTVVKVGYPHHNCAEYSAYKALECSVLGDLLAPCEAISKDGFALEMQFIPRALPQARGEYYWFNPDFVKVRDRLENHFSFIKRYNKYTWGADFHEEIDYSNLLSDMFSRKSCTTLKRAIRGVLSLQFPKVNITLKMKDRIISYLDDDVFYEVPVDSRSCKAII